MPTPTPTEVRRKFNFIIEHPKAGWLAGSRRERLRVAPVSTLAKAFVRRAIFLLVRLHLFPTVIRAKTFLGTVYAPVWGALPLIETGFNGGEGEDTKLTKFIIDTVKPGDIFIDGGANYGWYSLLANALGSKVLAIEPTKKTFEVLSKNAEGKNIAAYQAALWSSVGEMEFHDLGFEKNVSNTLDPTKNMSEEEQKRKTTTYKVRTLGLDDLPVADFIKLDCEGVEYEILSTAKRALESKPILAVELLDVARKSGVAERTVELLKGKGYVGYYIDENFRLAPLKNKGEAPVVNAIFLPAEIAV